MQILLWVINHVEGDAVYAEVLQRFPAVLFGNILVARRLAKVAIRNNDFVVLHAEGKPDIFNEHGFALVLADAAYEEHIFAVFGFFLLNFGTDVVNGLRKGKARHGVGNHRRFRALFARGADKIFCRALHRVPSPSVRNAAQQFSVDFGAGGTFRLNRIGVNRERAEQRSHQQSARSRGDNLRL